MQTAESWLMIHRGMTDLEPELYTPHNPDKDISLHALRINMNPLVWHLSVYIITCHMNNDKTLTIT